MGRYFKRYFCHDVRCALTHPRSHAVMILVFNGLCFQHTTNHTIYRYQIPVPDGVGPGQMFQANLVVAYSPAFCVSACFLVSFAHGGCVSPFFRSIYITNASYTR